MKEHKETNKLRQRRRSRFYKIRKDLKRFQSERVVGRLEAKVWFLVKEQEISGLYYNRSDSSAITQWV